ncbi:HSF-type DNA-binding-domain-containing protein, partial [Fennellomyces sp. T-0311]
RMLNDSSTNNLIHWSTDGLAICIPEVPEFSRNVLPQYFKHNNWPSFIRQLNLYGFHRVNLAKTEGGQQQTYYFMNEHFQRDNHSLLGQIKRR